MNQHINHSNYEAYFIDYLEGTLSVELQAEMENFMIENPDIDFDLDIDGLMLEATEDTADVVTKLALKKDLSIAELSIETLPYFAIASMEGQLSSNERIALENWLKVNEAQRPIFESYNQTRLTSEQLIYSNKHTLHRNTRIIPLWVKGSAIAASLALLITLGWNDQVPTKHVTASNTPTEVKKEKKNTEVTTTSNPTIVTDSKKTIPVVLPIGPNPENATATLASTEEIGTLPKRDLDLEHESNILAGNYVYEKTTTSEELPVSDDLSWIPLEAMRNPIAPLTNKLTEKLNTPVDFRTSRGTKNCGNGFLVRIGKFELSHRSACR